MKSTLMAGRAASIAAVAWSLVAAGSGTAAGEEKTAAALSASLLAILAENFWEHQLRSEPVEATAIGERRYDHLLADISAAAREREHEYLAQMRRTAAALVPE